MNDLERERDFYRRQCDDLGQRLLRLRNQQDRARDEARRSRLIAQLIREVYQLSGAGPPMAEVGCQFLQVVLNTLNANRAAVLKYQPDRDIFVAEYALGFPQAQALCIRPPAKFEEFHFTNSRTPSEARLDCLRQAAGVPYLLWAFSPVTGLALLVGNLTENEPLDRPFESADREMVEDALRVFTDISERARVADLLHHKTRQQEQLLVSARHLTSSLDLREVLTRIGTAAKEILGSDGCAIYLLEPDGLTLTPAISLDPPNDEAILSAPLDIETSMTGQAVTARRALVFNDVLALPSGQHIPGTPADEDERVIAAPFIFHDRVLGAICLRRLEKQPYSDEDLALAETFATYATAALRNAQSHDDLEQRMRERTASLAEKEVLLKEIHHRVKNNLQVVSSLLYLQRDRCSDETLHEAFRDSANRVRSMALVHERLYQSADLARIDFGEYVRSLAGQLFRSYAACSGRVQLKTTVAPAFLNVDTAVCLGLILNELVSNALKHAFPQGRSGEVRVEFGSDHRGRLILSVSDNGIGFSTEPDAGSTSSLGLRLVRTLVEQLAATIEFHADGGTTVNITLNT